MTNKFFQLFNGIEHLPNVAQNLPVRQSQNGFL
jgi:hypothetical protein